LIEEGEYLSDGEYFDVKIKAHKTGTNKGVIFIFTNVSAQKRLEREILLKKYS